MPTGLGSAALVTLSIYEAPAMCQGTDIVPAAAQPLRTASGPPDQSLSLSLRAGVYSVQVRAYRDTAGTQLFAQGCSITTVKDGAATCLELPVLAPSASDGGVCTPNVHPNGFGQSFMDCAPLGTYNAGTALEACAAYAGDGALCRTESCSDGQAVCSHDAPDCVCWTFSGSGAGHARNASGGGCDCGTANDPIWQ
jgi:hypothetical protein